MTRSAFVDPFAPDAASDKKPFVDPFEPRTPITAPGTDVALPGDSALPASKATAYASPVPRRSIFDVPDEPVSALPEPAPSRGVVTDIMSAIPRAAVRATGMGARALRRGEAPEEAPTLTSISDWAERVEKETPFLKPSKEMEESATRRAIIEPVESVVQSVVASAPGAAVGGAAGSVIPGVGTTIGSVIGFAGGAGTIFGAEKYDQVIQDARKQGLIEKLNSQGIDGEALVRDKAFQAGLIEGGVEAVADLALAKFSRLIPGASVAKEGVKDTIRHMLKTPIKKIAAATAKSAGVEASTEALQNLWEAQIEKGLGLKREDSAGGLHEIEPLREAGAAVVPAAGAGILFSLLGQGIGGVQKRGLIKRLYDTKADPKMRLEAAQETAAILAREHGNPLVARNWYTTAVENIAKGEPISADDLLAAYDYMIPGVPETSGSTVAAVPRQRTPAPPEEGFDLVGDRLAGRVESALPGGGFGYGRKARPVPEAPAETPVFDLNLTTLQPTSRGMKALRDTTAAWRRDAAQGAPATALPSVVEQREKADQVMAKALLDMGGEEPTSAVPAGVLPKPGGLGDAEAAVPQEIAAPVPPSAAVESTGTQPTSAMPGQNLPRETAEGITAALPVSGNRSSALPGNIKIMPSKIIVEGGRGNAKRVGDLFDVEALRSKGFDALDAPSQRMVLSAVLARAYDPKILDSVVGRDAVDMVNMLSGEKVTPDMLRNNPSVLKRLLSIAPDIDVSIFSKPSTMQRLGKSMSAITDLIAEIPVVSDHVNRTDNGGSASEAGHGLAIGKTGAFGRTENALLDLRAVSRERSSAEFTSKIDQSAHEAATSPLNALPEPTPGQKEAGNYKKGDVWIHGLHIKIENPKGSIRSGIDREGRTWNQQLYSHYGYIVETSQGKIQKGADKDHLDTFIGPDAESQKVYVVDQIDPRTGKFDELKTMVGYGSQEEARAAYLANYQSGWKGLDSMAEMSMPEFKSWLKTGDTTKAVSVQKQITPPVAANTLPGIPARSTSYDREERRSPDRLLWDQHAEAVAQGDTEKAKAIASRLAYRDRLTGLIRREGWQHNDAEGKYAKYSRRFFLDLDNFHDTNAVLTHEGGDQVLAFFGKLVRFHLGEGAEAARWGGDEFVGAGNDDLEARLTALQKDAESAIIPIDLKAGLEYPKGSGRILTAPLRLEQDGIRLSFGIGKDYAEAYNANEREKEARRGAGLRHDRAAAVPGRTGEEPAAGDEVRTALPPAGQTPGVASAIPRQYRSTPLPEHVTALPTPTTPSSAAATAVPKTAPVAQTEQVAGVPPALEKEFTRPAVPAEQPLAEMTLDDITDDLAAGNVGVLKYARQAVDRLGRDAATDELFNKALGKAIERRTRPQFLAIEQALRAVLRGESVEDARKLVKAEAPVSALPAAAVPHGTSEAATATALPAALESASPSEPMSPGAAVRVGKSPQAHTVIREIEATANEKALGERYFEVRNNRTGAITTHELQDLSPTKKTEPKAPAGEPKKSAATQTLRSFIEAGNETITQGELRGLYEVKKGQMTAEQARKTFDRLVAEKKAAQVKGETESLTIEENKLKKTESVNLSGEQPERITLSAEEAVKTKEIQARPPLAEQTITDGRVKTITGRDIPAPPEIRTDTPQKSRRDMQRIEYWLMGQALEEAVSRNDGFNATTFKGLKPGKFSQADKAVVNMYLFNTENPKFIKPVAVTKTGTKKETEEELQPKAEAPPVAAEEKHGWETTFNPNDLGYMAREVKGLMNGYFVAQQSPERFDIIESERGSTRAMVKKVKGRWQFNPEVTVEQVGKNFIQFKPVADLFDTPEAAVLEFNKFKAALDKPELVSQAEYVKYYGTAEGHKIAVQNALRAKRSVSPDALKSYPEMTEKQAAPPSAETVTPSPENTGAAKEPWEMTREEYIRSGGIDKLRSYELNAAVNRLGAEHHESVKQAIAEGKPVPEEVLKEYGLEKKDTATTEKVKSEKKQPKAKITSTDTALRRYWELRSERVTEAASKPAQEQLAAIQKETNRADLLDVPLAEDATPGARRLVESIRSNIKPFTEWAGGIAGGRRRKYSDKPDQAIMQALEGKHHNKNMTADAMRAYAKAYIEFLGSLRQELAGSKTIAEIAEKYTAWRRAGDEKAGSGFHSEYSGRNLEGPARYDGDTQGQIYFHSLLRRFSRFTPDDYSIKINIERENTVEKKEKSIHDRPTHKLEDIRREGLPNHRNGKDVTGEDLKKTFGFASVTLGKYVTQAVRQLHANHFFDSMHDLAKRIGAKPEDMSLGGTLHVAIGALGHGKYSATYIHGLPHPETHEKVNAINLTRDRGDGAVSHEWAHALDFYLRNTTAGNAVMGKIEQHLKKRYDVEYIRNYVKAFIKGDTFYKGSRNATRRNALQWLRYERNSLGNKGTSTEYYRNAGKLDGGKVKNPYWSNPREMFARAFESAVYDTLEGSNPYLVSDFVQEGKTKAPEYKGTPYPAGQERTEINQTMQELLDNLTWTEKGPEVKAGAKFTLDAGLDAYVHEIDQISDDIERFEAHVKEQEKAPAGVEKATEEVESVPATTSTLFTGMDDDALGALIDEQVAQEFPEKPQETREVVADGPQAAEQKAEKREREDKEPVKDERTLGSVAQEFKDAGVEGVGEALAGLYKLFGGGAVKSFPAGFDEAAYAAAKPHFIAAYQATLRAGRSAAEFANLIVKAFGVKIKPFLFRFMQDVRDGRISVDNRPENAKLEVTEAAHEGEGTDTAGRPEARPVVDGESQASSGVLPGEGVGSVPEQEAGRLAGRPSNADRESGAGTPEEPVSGSSERAGDRGIPAVEHGLAGTGTAVGRVGRPAAADFGLGKGIALRPDERNNVITDDETVVPATKPQRVKANIDAIRLVKTLSDENRNATPAEKKVLQQYTGWGALAQDAFLPEFLRAVEVNDGEAYTYWDAKTKQKFSRWKTEIGNALHPGLGGVLTKAELEAAKGSTLNAHYTERGVIKSVWEAVKRLGFEGGRVLEPAGGVGHFFGLMPQTLAENTELHGVELDKLSSMIFQKLYPQAKVQNTGFENARGIGHNNFDLVISNFPFGDYPVFDKRHPEYSNWNIHNYFFARALDAARPGGIVAAITSHYTMDSLSAKTRDYLAGKADLVGAIRLPNSAFKANAGTEVVTDIIFLRKKSETPMADMPGFRYAERTAPTAADAKKLAKLEADKADLMKKIASKDTPKKEKEKLEKQLEEAKKLIDTVSAPVNEYFIRHPEMVLGTPSMKGTMYGSNQYTVDPVEGADMPALLAKAVSTLPEKIMDYENSVHDEIAEEVEYDLSNREGSMVERSGAVKIVEDGRLVDPEWIKAAGMRDKAVQYVKIKTLLGELVNRELNPDTADEYIEEARRALNAAYDAFHKKHGFISEKQNADRLSDDSEFPAVAALEDVKKVPVEKRITSGKNKGQTRHLYEDQYSKNDIFTRRVNFPFEEPSKADTVVDAVQISLLYRNAINTAYIAELTGRSEADVRSEILKEGHAFVDPASGLLTSKEEYLSGPVKEKLRQAQAAAEDDPQYEVNVRELTKVVPKDIPIDRISFRLGSEWVPAKIIEDFAYDELGLNATIRLQDAPTGRAWTIDVRGTDRAKNQSTWGGTGFDGKSLLDDSLNLKHPVIKVTENTPGGKVTHVDQAATFQAQEKQRQMQEKFQRYVRKNEAPEGYTRKRGDFSEEIEKLYNELFNGTVAAEWREPNIEHFPGASREIRLRGGQKTGVYRGVRESTIFAHGVGTGKTFLFISLAMEMKRLKTARKSMVVVQNSTIDSYRQSIKKLYPTAKVLIPNEKQRDAQNRQKLFGQMRTGDYDIIVVPHSFFNMMPNNPAIETQYIQDELGRMEDYLNSVPKEDKQGFTAKQIEKAKKQKEAKLLELASLRQDKSLYFEDLGIDALLIDEAHNYKRGDFFTKIDNVKGLDRSSSARSFHLMLKTRHIQEKTGGKNVILATGTPISNTIAELWTMIRYTRPDLMKRYGIENFDSFVSAFARTTVETEQTATGDFKQVERLNKYDNGPELLTLWRSAADVVLPEDADIQGRPKIKGGAPQEIVVQRTDSVSQAIADIKMALNEWQGLDGKAKRELSWVPVVLYGKARQIAIDPRLADSSAPDDPGSKLNTAIRSVFKIWQDSRDIQGTQFVFSDFKQSSDGRFSLANEVREKLFKMGVPRNEVAIIDEYKKDIDKERAFEDFRQGKIRVFIGSTSTLGTGTNIQDRAVAAHHIDVPLRPMDFEQRNGRIVRHGNMNPEVEVYVYGVKDTLDSSTFQLLLFKQKFINQILRGEIKDRSFDDPTDEVQMSFEDAMAAFSGRPELRQKFGLETEIRKLESLRASHQDEQYAAQQKTRYNRDELARIEKTTLPEAVKTAEKVASVFPAGKVTGVEVDGKEIVENIGGALNKLFQSYEAKVTEGLKDDKRKDQDARQEFEIKANGQAVDVRAYADLYFTDGKISRVEGVKFLWGMTGVDREMKGHVNTGQGLLTSIAAKIGTTRDTPDNIRLRIKQIERDNATYKAVIDTPFTHETRLGEAKTELREVIKVLESKKDDDTAGKKIEGRATLDRILGDTLARRAEKEKAKKDTAAKKAAPKAGLPIADYKFERMSKYEIDALGVPGEDHYTWYAGQAYGRDFYGTSHFLLAGKPMSGFKTVENDKFENVFPKEEGKAVVPVAWNTPEKNTTLVYFSNGTVMDGNYFRLARQVHPKATYAAATVNGGQQAFILKKDGETVGIIMSRKAVIPPAVEAMLNQHNAPKEDEGPKYAAKENQPAPAFYSQLEKSAREHLPESVTAEGLRAFLRRFKFRQDDVLHSGIEDFIAENEGKRISKPSLLAFMQEKQAKIVPVEFGGQKQKDNLAAFNESYSYLSKMKDKYGVDGPKLRKRMTRSERDEFDVLFERTQIGKKSKEQIDPKFSNWKIPGESIPGSYVEHFETVPGEKRKIQVIPIEKKWGILSGEDKKWEGSYYTKEQAENHAKTDPYLKGIQTTVEKLPIGHQKRKTFYDVQDENGNRLIKDPSRFNTHEKALEAAKHEVQKWQDGHAPYSEVKNPIVRWRGDGRTTADGKKTFFIHEIQAPSAENQAKMPKWAQKRWREIGLKSALDYAVKTGYDSLSLASGEQVAGLYDLSKQVRSIEWDRQDKISGRKTVRILPTSGNPIEVGISSSGIVGGIDEGNQSGSGFDGKNISDVVGKDIGKKIIEEQYGDLSGLALKVGGEGIKKLYDRDLPGILNDMGKKWGAKVRKSDLGGYNQDVAPTFNKDTGKDVYPSIETTTLDIPPAMSESVMTEGQPLFATKEPAPAFYSQAERVIADKMPNRAIAPVVMNILNKNGVKADEIKWLGIEDYLKGLGRPATKQEVLDFIRANQIEIREVVKGGEGAASPTWGDYTDEDVHADELPDGMYRAFVGDDSLGDYSTKEEAMDVGYKALDSARDTQPTKFHQYQLPGGENYRELLLTLPEGSRMSAKLEMQNNGRYIIRYEDGAIEHTGTDSRAIAERKLREKVPDTAYRSSHWDEPNVLAHVRFNTRYTSEDGTSYTPPQAVKVLFIEEIQSDWHQEGKRKGYKPNWRDFEAKEVGKEWIVVLPDGGEVHLPRANFGTADIAKQYVAEQRVGAVPPAPFSKSWPLLAMKRMIRYAAENGYDRIAWTTGEQQAERYDLSKQIDALDYSPNEDRGGYDLEVRLKDHREHDTETLATAVPAEKLADYVGKDIAKKILDGEGQRLSGASSGWTRFSGLDLKVGGEGMKGFYDVILTAEVNKYVKKWGAKVATTELEIVSERKGVEESQVFGNEEQAEAYRQGRRLTTAVPSLSIPAAMRESIMTEGQPLFATKDTEAIIRHLDNTFGKNVRLASAVKFVQDMAKSGIIKQLEADEKVGLIRMRLDGGVQMMPKDQVLDILGRGPQNVPGRDRRDEALQLRDRQATPEENRAAVARLQDDINATRSSAHQVRIFEANPPDGADAADIAQLAQALHKNVIYVKVKGGSFFDGVNIDDLNVYVDASATDPHLGIVGHEIVHAIERSDPEAYQEFHTTMVGLMKDFDRYKTALNAVERETGQNPSGKLRAEKELIADFVGNRLTKPPFWSSLIKESPTVFQRVYTALRNLISRIRNEFRGRNLAFWSDIEKAEEIAAKFLAAHADKHGPINLRDAELRGGEFGPKLNYQWKEEKSQEGQTSMFAAKKPMRLTEKQFYATYYQHVLRKGTDIEKLKSGGFKSGIGPNARNADDGSYDNAVARKYAPTTGDQVMLVPKEFIKNTPNGPKIKDGFKPADHEIVTVERADQPMYELYAKAVGEALPESSKSDKLQPMTSREGAGDIPTGKTPSKPEGGEWDKAKAPADHAIIREIRTSGFGDEILILPNGKVEYRYGYAKGDNYRSKIQNAVMDFFDAAKLRDNEWYRGTNNKDEVALIKSGKFTNSKNWGTGESHKGISVNDNLTAVWQYGYKYVYRIKGIPIGFDQDGYPLLSADKIDIVTPIQNSRQIQKSALKQENERLKSHGWTREQFRSILENRTIKWEETDSDPSRSPQGGDQAAEEPRYLKQPSNLNAFQREQVGTKEFRRWFKDSKVVDENGEPMVVYHGSTEKFAVFDRSKISTLEEGGFFFTDVRELAADYGDNVISAYLSLRNPLTISYGAWANGEGMTAEEAQKAGYDGFVIEGFDANNGDTIYEDSGKAFVAFRPTQIKSATGNSGAFSAKNLDIRYSTKAADHAYLSAVEREDWPAVNKMVADAAKAAGYTVGPVFHGTRKDFTEFKKTNKRPGFFFHENESMAGQYAGERGQVIPAYLKAEKTWDYENPEHMRLVNDAFAARKNPQAWELRDLKAGDWAQIESPEVQRTIKAEGFDSFYVNDHPGKAIAVFSPRQIKSGDLVTYDDAGNVIPLSARFDAGERDIRYSTKHRGARAASAITETLTPFSAKPEHGAFVSTMRAIGGQPAEFVKNYRQAFADHDLTKLERLFGLPHHIAKWFPDFDRVMDVEEVRQENRDELRGRLLGSVAKKNAGAMHEFLGLGRESKKKVERFALQSDKENRVMRPEELTGLTSEEKSAYYAWKTAMDAALELRMQWLEKMNLLPYQNRAWYTALKDVVAKRGKKNRDTAKAEALAAIPEGQHGAFNDAYRTVVHGRTEIARLRRQIGRIKFYVPHQREGEYVVDVYDPQVPQPEDWNEQYRGPWKGKLVWSERAENKAVGTEALMRLRQKFPGMNVVDYTDPRTPEEIYQAVNEAAVEKFIEGAVKRAEGREGVTHEAAVSLRDALFETVTDDLRARGWERHAIKRGDTWVGGYQTADLDRVFVDYMSGLAGSLTKMEAAYHYAEALKKIDPRKKELQAFAQTYVKNMTRNQTGLDRTVGKMKAAAFTWYITGKLSMVPVQLTQNFVTGIPQLGRYTSNPMRKYLQAMADVTTEAKRAALPDDEREALRVFHEKGLDQAKFMEDVMGQTEGYTKGILRTINRGLGIPFFAAENFNRKSAFLAAYRVFRKPSGHEFDAEAFKRAKDFVHDTHFLMGRANKPELAAGATPGHAAVNLAYTFTSFTHNFVLSLVDGFRTGGSREGGLVLLRSLAWLAVFGGLTAIPFLDDLLDELEKLMGIPARADLRKALRGVGGKTLETLGMHGVPALLGADLSGTLKTSIPFKDGVSDTAFGVYGGLAEKLARGYKSFNRGDYRRMAEQWSPLFAENAMKGWRMYGEQATTPSGKLIYDDEGRPMQLTGPQAMAQGVGIRPERVSTAQAKRHEMTNIVTHYQDLKESVYDQYAMADTPEKRQKAMKRVREFNRDVSERARGLVKPITADSLRQSLMRKRRPDKRQRQYERTIQ